MCNPTGGRHTVRLHPSNSLFAILLTMFQCIRVQRRQSSSSNHSTDPFCSSRRGSRLLHPSRSRRPPTRHRQHLYSNIPIPVRNPLDLHLRSDHRPTRPHKRQRHPPLRDHSLPSPHQLHWHIQLLHNPRQHILVHLLAKSRPQPHNPPNNTEHHK